jgi:hypothetical protein
MPAKIEYLIEDPILSPERLAALGELGWISSVLTPVQWIFYRAKSETDLSASVQKPPLEPDCSKEAV